MAFDDPTLACMGFFQSLRESSPEIVTSFFRLVSEPAVYVYIPIAVSAWLLWFRDRRSGDMLMLNLLSAMCVNGFLKAVVNQPRPWVRDRSLLESLSGTHSGGSSFPSAHVSASAAGYGTLALIIGRRLLALLPLVMIALIAFSRLYLGVHTPLEVIAGILVASIVIVINLRLLELSERSDLWFWRISIGYIAFFAVICPAAVLIGGWRSGSTTLAMALVFGYLIGRMFMHRSPCPSFGSRGVYDILYLIAGFVLPAILLLIMPMAAGKEAGYVIAGAFTGLWISLFYPMILGRVSAR